MRRPRSSSSDPQAQRRRSGERSRRSYSCDGRDGRAHDHRRRTNSRAAGHVAMSSCTGLLTHPCLYGFSFNNTSCFSFVSGPVVDHEKNTARQAQQKLKADCFAEHKKQPRTGQEALRDATAEFFDINKLQLQKLD